MAANDFFNVYKGLLLSLKEIVRESKSRVLKEDPDPLFSNNVNFFIKSYLITTCTYLEAYMQDLSFEQAKIICARANSASIPHNFLYWQTAKEIKDKDLKFVPANFAISKKEIADEISANPYKTIRLFRLLGINLPSQERFQNNKEVVNAVVTKRNQIIHHNDTANDISFDDIESYIDTFIEYMLGIKDAMAA